MIELRAEQLFGELKQLENLGSITSRTGYLKEFYQRLHIFYQSIQEPMFQVREAEHLPLSKEYNDMLYEIDSDLQVLYEEAKKLRQKLEENFTEAEIDRLVLKNRLQQLEDRIKEISGRIEEGNDELIFREGFMNSSGRDSGMGLYHPAHIWTREGVLTLHPKQAESYMESATVRIIDGNGLPGNTKQAKSLSGEIRYVGEDAVHLDLADLLDGNSDTWFEYEKFILKQKDIDDARGYGFKYEEDIPWGSTDDSPLKLKLEIEFDRAVRVNWFSLNPFMPSDRGAESPFIESVEIHDGKGKVFRPLEEADELSNEKVYIFGKQDCKRILITLSQRESYHVDVGHMFYQEVETEELNYLERMKEQPGKRIDGKTPSIQSLGLMYDYENEKIIYPDITLNTEKKDDNLIKKELFELPLIDEEKEELIQNDVNLIPAKRQVIGIKDINAASYRFEETSDYVSLPYKTDRDIVGVSLVADQVIPKEFGEGDWVRYWITPDNGENWYRIHPRGTIEEGAKVLYLFNTRTPQEGRTKQFGYVDLNEPVRNVRVKIEMERPDSFGDAEYFTPVLKEYELHLVLGGGTL